MSRIASISFALVTLIALPAAAQPQKDTLSSTIEKSPAPERKLSPVSLGMRVGLSMPGGSLASGVATSDAFGVAMTNDLMLDIRLGRRFVLAPYIGYMRGSEGSELTCGSNAKQDDCGMFGVQGGMMLRATLVRTNAVDLWTGYAFSHDWQSAYVPGGSVSFSGNAHHLAFGLDFFVNDRTDSRMGGYVDVAAGRFDQGEVVDSYYGSGAITQHETHSWTTVGAQFVF